MTTIYLIRHAQAEGNLYRRCQGWYDGLITPKGYQQIAALANRFEDMHFDAVYSSDLFRAKTTASAIYRTHNLPLHTDPGLREITAGFWEGRSWGDILREDPELLLSFWHCDPEWKVDNGETFPEVQKRFCSTVERIASHHPDQTIAIFAHGNAIRTGMAHWAGLPIDRIAEFPHGNNTCVACLEYVDDMITIRFYNDDSHLSPELRGTTHQREHYDHPTVESIEGNSLYFIPLDISGCEAFYLNCRADAWKSSHGTMTGFNGEQFLNAAKHNVLFRAMRGDHTVGILELNTHADADQGTGRIPFIYILPEYRLSGLGVQMIGQAVDFYRRLGRQSLRLRCAPENKIGQTFYAKYGFVKIGEESGGTGSLDLLEKYIGYEHQ